MLRLLPRQLFHTICCFILLLSLINTVACQAVEQNHGKLTLFDSPEESIISAIEDELDMPVTLKVETRSQDDQWAFLSGLPLTSEGKSIDYSNTHYADDITKGYFDDGFVALAKYDKNNKGWALTTLSLGATDAPFINWPEQFGVPKDLIFPEN